MIEDDFAAALKAYNDLLRDQNKQPLQQAASTEPNFDLFDEFRKGQARAAAELAD